MNSATLIAVGLGFALGDMLVLAIRYVRHYRRLLERPWWARLDASVLVWREEHHGYSKPSHEFSHQAWERIFDEEWPQRADFLIYHDAELEVWRRGQRIIVVTEKGDEIRQLNRRDPS